MPIFEYRCNDCNESFEIFTLTSKKRNITCSICGSNKVYKLISSVGIIFKGSGFYVTDANKSKVITSDSKKETVKDPVKSEI